MRRSDDARPVIKVRIKKKRCPGKLLACPAEAQVLTDGEDAEAAALKADQDRLKRQQDDLKRKKQHLAIKKATQTLNNIGESRVLSRRTSETCSECTQIRRDGEDT